MPYSADRPWERKKKLLSDEPGTILKSTRAFGVEIECTYKDEEDIEAVADEIDDAIGIGGDGSIDGNGAEIRTPPASGKAAEAMMNELCASLNKHGCKVNKSCGLHVHIDAKDMGKAVNDDKKWQLVQNYWMFYIAMDTVIRSFLPNSRRKNSYCKKMEPVFEAVKKADSYNKLYEIYNSGDSSLLDQKARSKGEYKDPTRYRGINLHTLWGEWHPEIRYHNGTTQAPRILHWAYLHCLIMDKIMDGTITFEWIVGMYEKKSVKEKTKQLFRILGISKPTAIYLLARQTVFDNPYKFLLTTRMAEEITALTTNAN